MTKFKALGAICVAAALAAASPVLARGMGGAGMHMGAGVGAMHTGSSMGAMRSGVGPQFAARGTAQFAGHERGYHRHFGPGIGVGLAAGALLGGYYDPYYGDAYAYDYDDGYYSDPSFVCQPGTWFVGEDGRRYLCQ